MSETDTLEDFFLRYVEQQGGVWDAVEPQVYDVLLPEGVESTLGVRDEAAQSGGAFRVTFDPEALTDYAQAHLLAFGNPILDRIFEDAQVNHRLAKVYISGLNLTPHGLDTLVQRSLHVSANTAFKLLTRRTLHYWSALWWFQATFISDEKVQSTSVIGIDLHYGRPARHLEEALRTSAVSESRPVAYPDAPLIPLTQGYALAREEATRTITVAAHERLNDLHRFLQRETERISGYFNDSRAELDERIARAKEVDERERLTAQRAAYDREEDAQITELRRKMALSVQVRLSNVLLIVQPKLAVRIQLSVDKGVPGEITMTWDPAQQRLEAVPCPVCGRPTLALVVSKAGKISCPDCAGKV